VGDLLRKALGLEVRPLPEGEEGHLVRSEDRRYWYLVRDSRCACRGYRRHGRCKHRLAVEIRG
jgi:hypothetical protein